MVEHMKHETRDFREGGEAEEDAKKSGSKAKFICKQSLVPEYLVLCTRLSSSIQSLI